MWLKGRWLKVWWLKGLWLKLTECVQKYYEENPDFDGYDSFWTSMLVLMTISALGSLVAGIVNLFKILRSWPLRMEGLWHEGFVA